MTCTVYIPVPALLVCILLFTAEEGAAGRPVNSFRIRTFPRFRTIRKCSEFETNHSRNSKHLGRSQDTYFERIRTNSNEFELEKRTDKEQRHVNFSRNARKRSLKTSKYLATAPEPTAWVGDCSGRACHQCPAVAGSVTSALQWQGLPTVLN